jgi:predicted component of type VI protein secretion system
MADLDQKIQTKKAEKRLIENQQRITSNPSQTQQTKRTQQLTQLTNDITNAQADYDQLAQQRQTMRQDLDLDTMLALLDETIKLFASLEEKGTMPPQCLDLVFG